MAALLRIRASTPEPDRGQVDSYVERLLKLIPAEVVSVYLIGKEIAASQEPSVVDEWALACFVLVIVLRALMSLDLAKPNINRVQIGAVAVSAVSFVIWIYVLGDHIYPVVNIEQWMATLALLLWTPIAPHFYKGDVPEDPPK